MPSILRSVFGSRTATHSPGPWRTGMVRVGGTYRAGDVSAEQAMRLSAVFACIRVLSENIATMPMDTFIRSDGARRPFRPKPEYLSFQPPQGSRIDYLSQVMMSLLTDGNAFIATPRDDLGVPVTLVVIDPCAVHVEQDYRGEVTYKVASDTYDEFDILHIRAMTMPGALRGLSPLAMAAESVDLGLAAQRFGAAFFANGAMPGGVVEVPGEFDDADADRMKALWESKHRGVSNAGRVGVLTRGAKFSQVSIAPEQAQMLESRAFQIPDIARFFGVPPHLIADASNSTSWGSGLQEQGLAFGQLSLRPWVDRIEDAHGRLLTTHGLAQAFVKLNMDALLRAGTKDRYEAHQIGIEAGFLLRSEARRLEDLPPVPGIDDLPQPAAPVAATEPQNALTGGKP